MMFYSKEWYRTLYCHEWYRTLFVTVVKLYKSVSESRVYQLQPTSCDHIVLNSTVSTFLSDGSETYDWTDSVSQPLAVDGFHFLTTSSSRRDCVFRARTYGRLNPLTPSEGGDCAAPQQLQHPALCAADGVTRVQVPWIVWGCSRSIGKPFQELAGLLPRARTEDSTCQSTRISIFS